MALSAEKLLNFNSPGALVMGAEDAAEAGTILPHRKVMEKATVHPGVYSEPSVGAPSTGTIYLKFAIIMCRKCNIFVSLLLCLYQGTYVKFGQGCY